MNPNRILQLLALAGFGPLLATSALAQDSYFYGGAGFGQSRVRLNEQVIATDLLAGTGATITGVSKDSQHTTYKLFGGYQINRYLGVELGYFNLGSFHLHADTATGGTLDGRMRNSGVFGDLVGTLPVSDNFSVIGRVGAHYSKAVDNFSGTGDATITNTSPSRREGNAKIGIGLQYAFTPGFFMRAEAERYRVADPLGNHGNVDAITVSLVFPFGRAPSSAPMAMATPAYVEPVAQAAPMPEPVVAAAPMAAPAEVAAAAPTPRRVSFSAESLFVFDKATVQPDGMAELDAFAKDLNGTEFVTINVEGYTDRIGTPAYNQTLSEQRGEAVKAYLVNSGHVDASKISVVGHSEENPVTKPEDCQGNKANAELIKCLQPDRRVEIEVKGTR